MREDTWTSTRNKHQRVRILKLACMNPAVVFVPIALDVRSVILASGTLAPTLSFESELETQFPHKLHANHIIPREQVYVKCISRGPSGKSLVATYENANSFPFKVTTRMARYFTLLGSLSAILYWRVMRETV